jgi:hypothetical protein
MSESQPESQPSPAKKKPSEKSMRDLMETSKLPKPKKGKRLVRQRR